MGVPTPEMLQQQLKGEPGPQQPQEEELQQPQEEELQQPQQGELQQPLEEPQDEHPAALNQLKDYFTGQRHPTFAARTRCGGDSGDSDGSSGGSGGAASCQDVSGVVGLEDERAMELNFGDIIAMPASTATAGALVDNLRPEPKIAGSAQASPEWQFCEAAEEKEMADLMEKGVFE